LAPVPQPVPVKLDFTEEIDQPMHAWQALFTLSVSPVALRFVVATENDHFKFQLLTDTDVTFVPPPAATISVSLACLNEGRHCRPDRTVSRNVRSMASMILNPGLLPQVAMTGPGGRPGSIG